MSIKKIAVLLSMCFCFIGSVSSQGVVFEHGLSWQEVRAKAIAEKKYLFVDCYTTWCGPCIYLNEKIFPLKEMGDYFNERFISLKIQLDKKATDSDEVKSWYATADSLGKVYDIKSLPTFLFFDPQGELIHRMVGAGDPPADFIKRVSEAFDPEKQYYHLIRQYEQADVKDLNQLKDLAITAKKVSDPKKATEFANMYLSSFNNNITKESILFAEKFNSASKDKAFELFFTKTKAVNEIMGEGFAEIQVMNVLIKEELFNKPLLKEETVNWKVVQKEMKKKYGKHATQLVLQMKLEHAQFNNHSQVFEKEVDTYLKKYLLQTSIENLNSFAWTVFRDCPRSALTEKALSWNERVLAIESDYSKLHCKANLLYKLGRTQEAIETQQKVVEMAHEVRKKNYQRDLDKMLKGEKTWNVD